MTISNFSEGDTYLGMRTAVIHDTPYGFSQLSSQDDGVYRHATHYHNEQHAGRSRHEQRWYPHWSSQIPMLPQPTGSLGVEENYEQKYSPQVSLQSYPSHTPSSSDPVTNLKYHDLHYTAVGQHAGPGLSTPNVRNNPDSKNLTISQTSDRVGPPVLGVDLTIAEAESRLRQVHNLPAGVPLNLTAIPDPPPPQVHQDTLVQIAIWSSPSKRLIAADIYTAIQARFRSFPEGPDQPWRRSIRHMLSFKRAYVKSNDKDHAGRHFWELDFDHLDQGYKRERKRGGAVPRSQRGKTRHLKGGELSYEESGFDEILVDQDELYLKEEYYSPSPSPLLFYTDPLPSDDSSDTVVVSAHRSGRTRYSRSHSYSSQTGRRPASRQNSSTSGSPPLGFSGPVYLYPPGGYQADLKEAVIPMTQTSPPHPNSHRTYGASLSPQCIPLGQMDQGSSMETQSISRRRPF
ncbi:hypothetical protein E1B28_010605 [Marasmius oreades]|uniref:Fork-head domain-containing protein n=1 Tax=Marasmius oreades TaxID=181124 RepID=A0A9P7RY31_9AGAR|nr:uncharacterized protein E1B28_010605 [Marasmius oreades]KAG7091583.1 hypothetical protein E1B28_010605 [Marasmius oreades]